MPPARPATASPRNRARTSPRRGSRPGSAGAPRRLVGPPGLVRLPPHARVRWDRVGRVALLLVLGIVVLLYVQHALAYVSARGQVDRQRAIVRSLEHQNAQLMQQERSLRDPATLVLDARRLGMVRPGERPYAITGAGSNVR